MAITIEGQYQFALPLTYEQFWETCPKGEWLLYWIVKEKSTDHKLIVHAACQCARLALPYCKDKQQRPLKAIETTEKWCRGEATLEEVKQAENAAWNARSSAYAAAAAFLLLMLLLLLLMLLLLLLLLLMLLLLLLLLLMLLMLLITKPPDNPCNSKTADLVRSLIPRPDKMVEEYEHILKLKAFL